MTDTDDTPAWVAEVDQLARRAFAYAIEERYGSAVGMLGRIAEQYGFHGIDRAMLDFCDVYTRYIFESDEIPGTPNILVVDSRTGAGQTDLTELPEHQAYAMRLLAARGTNDEDEWYRICAEITEAQAGVWVVLELLTMIANTINLMPEGAGVMGQDVELN